MTRALPFLAGIVFGLILGYLAATYLASRRPVEEPSRSSLSQVRSERPEVGELESREPESSLPAEPVVAASGEGFATLSDALAAIEVDPVRTGSGTITGRITDNAGDGVGGVVVRAQAKQERTSTRTGKAPARKSLETKVRDVVVAHHYGRMLDAETTTSADGRYSLSGIGDARYSLRAYREGYEFSATDWQRASDATAGDEVDFRAMRKYGVEVAVRLPDGSTPPRATILAKINRRTYQPSWSPDSPRLDLEAGVYGLTGIAGDRKQFASKEVRVTVDEDSHAETVTLDLVARNGIIGRVTIPPEDGSGSWMAVRILRTVDGVLPSPEQLTRDGRHTNVGHYRPTFEFFDLAPGTYAIGVARGNERVREIRTVVVADDVVDIDLEVPSIAESGAIVLWAYGPDGSDLSDVSASARVTDAGGASYSTSVGVSKRNEGGHWLALEAALTGNRNVDDLENSKVELTVQSERYGSERVEVHVGTDRDVTVRFGEPAELVLTLAGYVGSGHEGELTARLSDAQPNSSTMFMNGEGFDVEGRMRLGPVQPGDYQVELRVRSGQHYRNRFISSTPVTLGPGVTELTLEIPALYTLVVRVPEGGKSRSFSLANEAEDSWSGTRTDVDESGRAVFRKIAAGAYTLTDDSDMMSGMMRVRIPDQLDVLFEPTPVNALRVTITDPDGGLAKAGFLDGDIVIGVDGKEFGSMMELQMRLMASMTQESTRLLLSRNGATVEVEADLRGMSDPSSMGGRMSPRSR